MATKMPPHNLKEIIEGIVALAKNKDITIDELLKIVKGPDFPTGGIIYGLGGVRDAYTTGKGTFKLRGKCRIEESSTGKGKIIITEIPYQVNKATLVQKIGDLVKNKEIEGITSIKDFSKKDVHIEIECRKDVVPQVILNQIYKNTQLEVSYGVINLCIVDGSPKILSLKELLEKYLEHQKNIIVKRTNFLKRKDEARMHIVDALLVVQENVDEIVNIAKSSSNPSEFATKLMERYNFDEDQAKAVTSMPLSRLTGIEAEKLINEKAQLLANIEKYNYILSSEEHVLEVVVNELEEVKAKFGDARKLKFLLKLYQLKMKT